MNKRMAWQILGLGLGLLLLSAVWTSWPLLLAGLTLVGLSGLYLAETYRRDYERKMANNLLEMFLRSTYSNPKLNGPSAPTPGTAEPHSESSAASRTSVLTPSERVHLGYSSSKRQSGPDTSRDSGAAG